jgi:hypothetical protein
MRLRLQGVATPCPERLYPVRGMAIGGGAPGPRRYATNAPQHDATPAAFERWTAAAFAGHLAELEWAEITRALRALSVDYVHRRERLARAVDGRGKRAAFALYYAPRHYVLVREVLRAVGAGAHARPDLVVDLGCGTGVAGAAWSALWAPPVSILGVDTQAWALDQARAAYRGLDVPGRTLGADLSRLRWPRGALGVVAAFTANELQAPVRTRLRTTLAARAQRGDALLVIEPLAKRTAPWWPEWEDAFVARGGRADEWRFPVELPERVAALGRSAGLDPRDLGCRSLWIPARDERAP